MGVIMNYVARNGSIWLTATSQRARIITLQKREPTLEDVFVRLVGQRMEEVEHADASAG